MALTVDPVDAANCAEVLAEALRERCEAVFAAAVGRVALAEEHRGSTIAYRNGGGMCLGHGLVLDGNGVCPYVPLDGEAP